MGVGGYVVLGVEVQRAVVFLPFGGCAEGCVGVGYGDEPGAGFGVVWIPVRVVGFGEAVEGSGGVLC